ARKTINAWVERETQDKIKELLKPNTLTGGTRLVLTNAIYFKGDWDSKFDKQLTKEAPFTLADGKKVKVPLMSQERNFKHDKGDDFQAVELPYTGKELAMLVLLPTKADGLPALEKKFTAERLAEVVAKLKADRPFPLFLPRFKMSAEFRLNDA